ncbi:MAG: c-type cytochrome [Alphaproteobacteria bacterium]|nr:c-type cytochrome [Alphaproteobacteria bacterium]
MSTRAKRPYWFLLVILIAALCAATWFHLGSPNKTAPLPVLQEKQKEKPSEHSSENKIDDADDDPASAEQRAALQDLINKADPRRGHSLVHMCIECHTFDEDGPVRFGPNLFGIVGSHHASKKGFVYSEKLKSMQDKIWTEENLNAFLTGVQSYAPGTRMTYPGVPKAEDRADIIAYLKTLKP